ncbi:MAG: cytochrome c [Deltaproteobacteria bacterium]|nr:cytochrome c [Deltaproteobacteria bacterium]
MRKIALAVALAFAFAGQAIAVDGAKIFAAKCSACHGVQGQGTAMAPAFKGNEYTKDAAAVKETVTTGREGGAKKYPKFPIGMPKQNLPADELDAVIAHIQSLR